MNLHKHVHVHESSSLLFNIPAPVQGENLNDRALTSLSPAQRLMKAFWNSTPEMKDKEREKEISLWLPQTHVCLLLSLFTRFVSFSAQSGLCKGIREGKKRKLLLLVLAQHSFPSFALRLPDPGSLPIVCLIDYFPCNYVCVILDFSLFEAQGSDPPSEGQQLHCSKSRMWLYY